MRPVRTSPSGSPPACTLSGLTSWSKDRTPRARRRTCHPCFTSSRESSSGPPIPLLRRMRTTFRHHNLDAGDELLWHLPAEKKTGFGDLFAQVTAPPCLNPRHDAEAMGLSFPNYARTMGWPRRRASLSATLTESAGKSRILNRPRSCESRRRLDHKISEQEERDLALTSGGQHRPRRDAYLPGIWRQ